MLWQHIVAMTATNGLDLNLVSAFVRVVEDGSFTAAARQLGLPKSSVSRRVTALEKTLRVRLLQRSTRKLVLTEAGRLYFERARASLGGLADAGAAVDRSERRDRRADPLHRRRRQHRLPGQPVRRVPDPLPEGADGRGADAAPGRPGRRGVRSGAAGGAAGRFDADRAAAGAHRAGAVRLARLPAQGGARRGGSPIWPSTDSSSSARRTSASNLRLTGPDGEETVQIAGPLVVHDMGFAADAISTGLGIGAAARSLPRLDR